ncbi:hypothetical protein FQZ97_705670 [compost metagenome]
MVLATLPGKPVGNLPMQPFQEFERGLLVFAQLRRHRDRRGVLGQLQRRAADQVPCIVVHWHADQFESERRRFLGVLHLARSQADQLVFVAATDFVLGISGPLQGRRSARAFLAVLAAVVNDQHGSLPAPAQRIGIADELPYIGGAVFIAAKVAGHRVDHDQHRGFASLICKLLNCLSYLRRIGGAGKVGGSFGHEQQRRHFAVVVLRPGAQAAGQPVVPLASDVEHGSRLHVMPVELGSRGDAARHVQGEKRFALAGWPVQYRQRVFLDVVVDQPGDRLDRHIAGGDEPERRHGCRPGRGLNVGHQRRIHT